MKVQLGKNRKGYQPDACHPACKCREAKVEELVKAATEKLIREGANSLFDVRLQSAIEGVKS